MRHQRGVYECSSDRTQDIPTTSSLLSSSGGNHGSIAVYSIFNQTRIYWICFRWPILKSFWFVYAMIASPSTWVAYSGKLPSNLVKYVRIVLNIKFLLIFRGLLTVSYINLHILCNDVMCRKSLPKTFLKENRVKITGDSLLSKQLFFLIKQLLNWLIYILDDKNQTYDTQWIGLIRVKDVLH